MNRKELHDVLNNFLSSQPEQKVLLIKGDWGIGKSYFIENTIKELKNEIGQTVAITSLFGVSDFNQCIDRLHYPIQNTKSTFSNFVQLLNKVRNWLPKNVPSGFGINLNLDNLFQSIITVVLKDGILVIDDVERKNNDLSLEKVLGSASYLAEKILNKVIIVFSEKNLIPEDKKAINELREKVVDLEYLFSPTAEENAKLILNSSEKIEVIKILEITNIRIIKKTKYVWSELVDKFEFKSEFVRNEIIKTIGILCFIHYSDIIPISLDDIPKHLDWLLSKEEDDKVKYAKQLEKMGYYFDERQHPIFDFLKLGFIDKEKWQSSINSFESNYQTEELKKAISKQWNIFNGNFKPNFKQVTSEFKAFLDSHSEEMYPRQVLEMLRLFDNIGYDYDDFDWLNKSTRNNIDILGSQDIKSLKGKVGDPDILKLLKEKEDAGKYSTNLEKAIKKIVNKGAWNQEDTLIIQNSSEDDFKEWLKNSDDEYLLPIIRKAYEMLRQFDEGYKKAAEKLYSAAMKIVEESETDEDKRLNKERVETFLKN